MKIAVVLSNDIMQGGGFQQEFSTISLLNTKQGEYDFVFYTTKKVNVERLKKEGISVSLLYPGFLWKLFDFLLSIQIIGLIRKKLGILEYNYVDRKLKKQNIDLVYFLSPCEESLLLENHSFIITVWDLCHRDYPEFPEVSHFKKFESRELYYRSVLPKAFKIITDSEMGSQNVQLRYGIDASRTQDIPFLPANGVTHFVYDANLEQSILQKYQIPKLYVFYPAQFYPHKNHAHILDGIYELKNKHGIEITAIFCGSKRGNHTFIEEKAKALGISDMVRNIGFVENEEIPYLYKNALALVMPTYFGPTNIPPLEAFSFDCPVLYSQHLMHSDFAPGAFFPLDFTNPAIMAGHIMDIIDKKPIVEEKKMKGKQFLAQLSATKNWQILHSIFQEYKVIMGCWKM